jgi:hypothetical protein
MLMTLYPTGARNAELTRLKFSDFGKQRMVVHIQGGKGRKDRDVMLSSNCSKNFVSTGTAYAAHPKCGSFPASTTIAEIRPSIQKPFGMPATKPRSGPAFRNACIRTP